MLGDDPLPTSVTHTSELTPVYEDILPPEKRKKIEVQGNVAYGTGFSAEYLSIWVSVAS